MNDGSSNFSGLREEWSLLVHSFIDQDPEVHPKLNANDLSLEQIQVLQKELSLRRRTLNQKIDDIKKEIEDLNAVTENLILVGSNTVEIQNDITALHQDGEKVSNEIFAVEAKIKKIHDLKEKMLILADLAQAQ